MNGGVTFVDPVAPRPYSGATGALAGLGGTESTLVRVCERLAAHMPVRVRQAARQLPMEIAGGVSYADLDPGRPLPENPDRIVVVNSWKVAPKLARLHPHARVHVWLHVFPGRHTLRLAPALKEHGVDIICVSRSQARWLQNVLGGDAPSITHVHNPIAEDLAPDKTARDPNLLLFASSPHKGLAQVFERFDKLKTRFPDLRLAVADPGYLDWPTGRIPDGVLPLGRLSQPDLVDWMRRSLCLFYPQDQFAETFGLVIAEANAVGCPALLHRGLGANDEVASGPDQCIDTTDPEAIAARIAEWRAATPMTPLGKPRTEFRLSRVAAQWARLLEPVPQPTRATA